MAAESVSNLLDLLKEVWTQDRLEKQFYDGTRWLDKVEKTNKYTIGRKAEVPLEKSLPGGTSNVPASGSAALNAADALHVDRAEYDICQIWQQVAIEAAALNQADSVGMRSTVDAQDQTVTSNVLAMRKELNRQSVSNGDALIAKTTGTATSATIALDPTGYGYDAIVRGWLRPGHVVDIGTAADETTITTDKTVTAVAESSSAPTVTISSSVTLSGTTYVSIANNRSGTTSYETNGLRTIVGSASSAIGTLDPDNAGEEFWKPASVDTSTTVVSLDLLLTLQRAVYQKTGTWPTYVTTSPKQAANLYALFEQQVRFQGDNTSAGNVDGFTWNGLSINVDPDIPDRELYMLTLSDFFVVTGGKYGKPTWASDIQGANTPLLYAAGTTQFKDSLYYAANVAIKRRNSHAAAVGLTA
jgi:hypothetical protein